MKFCKKCGKEVFSNRNLCLNCEKAIKNRETQKLTDIRRKNKSKVPQKGLLIVSILFIIFMLYFVIKFEISSKKSEFNKPSITSIVHKDEVINNSESKVVMTYNNIMRRLSDIFLMKSNPLLDGSPRYIGQTSDNGVQIELIGNTNNITKATLIVFLSENDYIATERTKITIVFLNDTVPGISADWFEKTTLQAANKLERGLNPNKVECIGQRKIRFKVDPILGCFIITIK